MSNFTIDSMRGTNFVHPTKAQERREKTMRDL